MKFLDNMSFGQYVPADTWLHRLDPRGKIVSVIMVLVGVFMASHVWNWALWVALFIMCAMTSKIKISFLIKSVRAVLFLILFTAVLNLLFAQGEPLWKWGILSISREGISMAWKMSLRLILLVLFANLLTLTTSPMMLADGLESLLSPLARFGFPSHELAMMMTIALRFIPTLLGETDRILKAQIARGADLDHGSLMKRMKAFLPVLVPLFVIVFQRADDLAIAMESRCYRGGTGRTRMKPFKWRAPDSFVLAASIALVVGQKILNRVLA